MFALEAITVIIFGFIFLRIAGKKVIAEMTPLEMVTVLATGTMIGHAVSEEKLWATIITMGIFVCVLIVFQYISLKWHFFQRLIIGKPTLVIRDGVVSWLQANRKSTTCLNKCAGARIRKSK